MRFKRTLQSPGARRTGARHHHGSDTPTSARAILHHTDQKGPKFLKGSVCTLNLYYLDIDEERKRVILSICCVIPIVFTIWTLTVAQKARKEIQEDAIIEPE